MSNVRIPLKRNESVLLWTITDVERWASSIWDKEHECITALAKMAIDGATLVSLTQAACTDASRGLGISESQSKELMMKVKEVKKETGEAKVVRSGLVIVYNRSKLLVSTQIISSRDACCAPVIIYMRSKLLVECNQEPRNPPSVRWRSRVHVCVMH